MRVALTLVLLAAFAGVSGAAAAPQQPRIVFAADRAATRNGEIYSFDLATGRTRDISRSFADDSGPAVSPDGKWIAFGSMRTGTLALYIARIDGSGLRLVKQFRAGLVGMSVQWSPDGTRLAAVGTPCCSGRGELWIGTPSGVGATRWDAAIGYAGAGWSFDGKRYAYLAHDLASTELASLDVVDASGHLLWTRDADQTRDLGWSADGRLAWMTGGTAHLATESGSSLPGFPARNIAWSPDGRTLAAVRTRSIELRQEGVGAPRTIFRGKGPHGLSGGINWLGTQHVVVGAFNDDGFLRVDIRTGASKPVGYEDVSGVASPDQRQFAFAGTSSYRDRDLRVGSLLGGSSRVVARTKDCSDDHSDPYEPVAFVPGTQVLVYLASCGDPTADLYSVRADGSGLKQLTFTAAHEQTPVLSPDGTRIAFIRSASIGHGCEGCPSQLWVMNVDGSHAHQLTSPGLKNEIGDWDADPSWSPDGKSVLFDRSAADSWLGLFAISAAGGTPTSLHIPQARKGVWGPQRIAYSGEFGAIWAANPDGSDRTLVAERHTCDSNCFYAWTKTGLVYATVKTYVTHSTLWIRGAGPDRRVQLPFRPAHVAWVDGGATLLVTAPVEGDLYRVEANGTLSRLTRGLGSVSVG